MALLIAVYKTPKNAAAFNDYYFSKHVPLAKTVPGLRGYQVSDGAVGLPVDPGAIHLVAMLEFDNVEAIGKALASPEGQATAGDLGNFADGGVDLIVFNTKSV
ncbi:MAG: EthD family reductase [Hyphomicrobiales bacterium]|nr:EthD family reductase [Hyphomicrobiales bacterium]